jgi:anti-sigma-K factor RskA
MSILAMGHYQVPNGKILRVWLKPAHGKPIALGRLPHTPGKHEIIVSSKAERLMPKATAIMVSLEDVSHAGDPSPSGKLMWKAPVVQHTG